MAIFAGVLSLRLSLACFWGAVYWIRLLPLLV